MESWTYCDYEIAKKMSGLWIVMKTVFGRHLFGQVKIPLGEWILKESLARMASDIKISFPTLHWQINLSLIWLIWFVYWRVRKILNLRVFDDDLGQRWKKSVVDKNLEVLCVSQVSKNRTHSYFEWCSMPFMYVQF